MRLDNLERDGCDLGKGGCQLERHIREVISQTWNYSGRADTPEKEVLNAVLGLAGEAGEVADLHKKLFFHSREFAEDPIREEELISELGDVMYYWLKIVELYGFSVEDILNFNREKLMERKRKREAITPQDIADAKEIFGEDLHD